MKTKLLLAAAVAAISLGAAGAQAAPAAIPGDVATNDPRSAVVPVDHRHYHNYCYGYPYKYGYSSYPYSKYYPSCSWEYRPRVRVRTRGA